MSHQAPANGRHTGGETEAIKPLVAGALVFRWVWLLWMIGLAYSGRATFARPALAAAGVVVAFVWTVWLTWFRPSWGWGIRVADLVVCGALVLASGVVVAEGDVVSKRPFFATGFPLSAALVWGATAGVRAGFIAGAVLGVLHLATRPLNGIPLNDLTLPQVQNVLGAMLNYLVAGVAVGLVWRLLVRSAEQVRQATDELVQERERSARLAERESMARAIHDSVLQSLTLVHKRGRELAARDEVPPSEVAGLAALAAKQEADLRTLILRPPAERPVGTASLREALESSAREVEALDVAVTGVGPLWLERAVVDEVVAAVRQALENVVHHAAASRATVFADLEHDLLTVSVRDDGVGFLFDEEDLRRRGKVGILKSIKGRIEDLGGRVSLLSRPGEGTEIEFEVPVVLRDGDDT